MSGVFAVSRDVFDHPVFAPEPFTEREAWIWLVGAAAWKKVRLRVGKCLVDLERGQLAFSTRFLAAKWKWAESRVRRFLKRLKTDAMIDAQTTRQVTQITICNYDEYQFQRRTDDAQIDAESDAVPTQYRRKEEEVNKGIREEAANAAPPPSPQKRKKQLPEGWIPNDTGRTLATNAGFRPEVLLESFTDYHRARGSVMLDWDAAFRTWIKNQLRFQNERAPNARRTGHLAGLL